MPRVSKDMFDDVMKRCLDPEEAVRQLNMAELALAKNEEEWRARKENPVWHVCPICKKVFWRYPSWTARAKVLACSKFCSARYQAWSDDFAESREKRREKVKETIAKKRAERERLRKNSPPPPKRKMYMYGDTIYVPCPDEYKDMARENGYVPLHRLNAAKKLGRSILTTERVYHLNGDPMDNSPENLKVFASSSVLKKFLRNRDGISVISPSRVKCPEEFSSMATSDGKVLEYRLEAAKKLGRPLKSSEFVVHVDGNEKNNAHDNLRILITPFRAAAYKNGVLVECPEEFFAMAGTDGFVREDMLQAAQFLGRPLKPSEMKLFPPKYEKVSQEEAESIAKAILKDEAAGKTKRRTYSERKK